MESADVVLVGNDLLAVVDTIKLSGGVIRNIKENLFWAFIYNIIGIPLAAGLLYPGFGLKLSPMIGAAAMSMSSVCVVLNALRLKGFRFQLDLYHHRCHPVRIRYRSCTRIRHNPHHRYLLFILYSRLPHTSYLREPSR